MTEIETLLEEIEANPKRHCKKQRQLVDLIRQRLDDPGLTYDNQEPRLVISFLQSLTQRQLDFAGKKLRLLNWQKLFIHALYGFKDKDGNISHTDTLLEIGKKNGKTLLGSGLILYNLVTKKGAQIFSVATDYNQAKIAFENVENFIYQHPKLRKMYDDGDIIVNARERFIKFLNYNNEYRCISEDRVKNLQGYLPAFILFDEIASYKNSEIINKLNSAKPEGAISLSITTAETNITNPGYFAYLRAEKVLSNPREASKALSFLPIIYELDEEDNWLDEGTYYKANPSLDYTTTTLKKLIEERDKALQSTDPLDTSQFRAYKLNQWLRSGIQAIEDKDWNVIINNYSHYCFLLEEDKLKEYPCYAAIDLSKNDDYTAYTLCFFIEKEKEKKFYFRHIFYIPDSMIQKKLQTEKGDLQAWIDSGLVVPTHGGGPNNKIINYEYLKRQLKEDVGKYQILGLAVDPACYGYQIIKDLNREMPELNVLPFSQRFDHLPPANRFYLDQIFEGNLIDANPVMTWMISCLRISYGTNNLIYFEKEDYKQSPNRIDGVDTSVMSLSGLKEALDIDMTPDEIDIDDLRAFYDLQI